MNKKIGFILALVLMAFLVMGAASAGFFDFLGGGDSENTTTNDDQTFIVGFDDDFSPYGYKDGSGNYVGFDLDLAKEVCKRNNWTFKAQPIDWDAKDAELDSGLIDCIWNGFTINERENDYTWSEPYIDNKEVIVVKGDSGIGKLSDLKGKTVEVQKDSSTLASLQDKNKTLADSFGELKEVAHYNNSFEDLESGACDAVAIDFGVAMQKVSNKENGTFVILPEIISSEQYGVGFKKGNTELKDKVQKTLDEMFEDGTVQEISLNYTDSGIPGSLVTK